MPRLLVVADAKPPLRLLTWALIEEGFEVEQCSPEAAAMRVGAAPPEVALVNCGELDHAAMARLVARMLLADPETRVIILGDAASAGDRVRYVPTPYRVADIVREIAEGSADGVAT